MQRKFMELENSMLALAQSIGKKDSKTRKTFEL
jgi:hypothetical protein